MFIFVIDQELWAHELMAATTLWPEGYSQICLLFYDPISYNI
jgi:hypothetical protein